MADHFGGESEISILRHIKNGEDVSNNVMTEIASLRYLATTHGGRGWWIEG
jgi:hypothetical protein